MKRFIAIGLGALCMASCGKDVKSVDIVRGGDTLQIVPMADNAIRIIEKHGLSNPIPELIYTAAVEQPAFAVSQTDSQTVVSTARISVVYDKATDLLTFYDAEGKRLMGEEARHSDNGGALLSIDSPEDEVICGGGQFQDGYLNARGLQRRLTQVNTQIAVPMFTSSRGFALLWNNYGLTDLNPAQSKITLERLEAEGQTTTVDVTTTEGNKKETRQNNTFGATLSISEAGDYSLLLDVGQTMARRHNLSIDGQTVMEMKNLWLPPTSSTIVRLGAGEHTIEAELEAGDNPTLYYSRVTDKTTLSSPIASGVDYTVYAGTGDEAIATYRRLSGGTPMMPRWALGYIHCRERYHSQDEIIEAAQRFRAEELPMDMIVQDWQWWGPHGWNAMEFDTANYPNPKALVDSLHSIDARLMLSVWSKIDPNSTLGKEMGEKGYYIDGTSWIDFFDPEAANAYWTNFSNRLMKPTGIDAWWQDATEPENDDLNGRMVARNTIEGNAVRNVYPMMVNKTVYEGLRTDDPSRRAMILTRSGFSGIQRYGAALWSGDVGNDWETLRRQITGGLSLMASGLPWWTYDAGGFFRPWDQYTSAEYHERFARWFQTSTFLPLMRVHGYMSNTELWNYGKEVEEMCRTSLSLRYELMPYIYAMNADVHFDGSTVMRPLIMDFADDREALTQKYEYMFGRSILVSPVVEPQISEQRVYLPHVEGGWYDLYTGKHVEGNGQYITVKVEKDRIPAFVRAGSVIVKATPKQTTRQTLAGDYMVYIYPGADGQTTVYTDNGEDYAYEKGSYARFTIKWDDKNRQISNGNWTGSNSEYSTKKFTFVVVNPETGADQSQCALDCPWGETVSMTL